MPKKQCNSFLKNIEGEVFDLFNKSVYQNIPLRFMYKLLQIEFQALPDKHMRIWRSSNCLLLSFFCVDVNIHLGNYIKESALFDIYQEKINFILQKI